MAVPDLDARVRVLEFFQVTTERELRRLRDDLEKCVRSVGDMDVANQVASGVSVALERDARKRAEAGRERHDFRFSLAARLTALAAVVPGIVATVVLVAGKF